MREMTRDCTLFEQVVIVRRMMLLPFGTKPPFRRPRTSDEDVELVRDIFDGVKNLRASTHRVLWIESTHRVLWIESTHRVL